MKPAAACPHCGLWCRQIAKRRWRTVTDIPMGAPGEMRVLSIVFQCQCGKFFTLRPTGLYPGFHITERLAEYIRAKLNAGVFHRIIAKQTGLHILTITKLSRALRAAKASPRTD